MLDYIVLEDGWSFIDRQKNGLPTRMNPELRKYLQAQRMLCGLLPHEISPVSVVKPPGEIYKMLIGLGFVWYKTSKRWYISHANRAKIERKINQD